MSHRSPLKSHAARSNQPSLAQDEPNGQPQSSKAIGSSAPGTPRQPFGVKNVMPQNTLARSTSLSRNLTKQGHDEEAIIKKQLAPVPRQTADRAKAHRFLSQQSSKFSAEHSNNNANTLANQLGKPVPHGVHGPSPLGASQGQRQANQAAREQIEESIKQSVLSAKGSHGTTTADALSLSVVKTPRKRAVPLEDVHCRNVVDDPVHKKSRSSRDGGTSSSITAAIDNVNLRSGDNVAAKTVRIARLSQAQADRANRENRRNIDTAEWRKRFLRAFPTFRFYLDGFDVATKDEVTTIITTLGGHVESFFSNSVTHLVTSRKVSLPPMDEPSGSASGDSKNNTSAYGAKGKSSGMGKLNTGPSLSAAAKSTTSVMIGHKSVRLPAVRKKNTSIPLHSERNPFDEWAPPVQANDILVKARNLGIKIWSHDKFKTVVAGLTGNDYAVDIVSTLDGRKTSGLSAMQQAQMQHMAQHANTHDQQQQSHQLLSKLLAKEKAQGTHERDPKAARTDYHYFSRNCVYVLVEDATGEHRPIIAQEWRKPVRDDEDVSWPILHGELEGRCPFTKFSVDGDPRKRMRPNRHETLRRSVSFNHHIGSQHRNASLSPAPSNDSRQGNGAARGASPYPLASGNSISIASTNITSTTSAAAAMHGNSLGLLSPFHPLARKTTTGIGMGRPSTMLRGAPTQQNAGDQTPTEQVRGSLVRRMLGMTDGRSNSLSVTTLSHQSAVTANGMRRSVSTPLATTEAAAKAAEAKTHEKRPGYCENCRVKYDDFDDHVVSRRHRKFATDDANFSEIDALLRRVQRPIAAWAVDVSMSVQDGDEMALSDDYVAEDDLVDIPDNDDEQWHQQRSQPQTADGSTRSPAPRDTDGAVQLWQREATDRDADNAGDRNTDEMEQQLAVAAAAFRIRTGANVADQAGGALRQSYSAPGGLADNALKDDLSTSSPGTPSCGITLGHGTEESAFTASPSTSPHLKPIEQDAFKPAADGQCKLTSQSLHDPSTRIVTGEAAPFK